MKAKVKGMTARAALAARRKLLHRRKLVRDRERRYQAMNEAGKRVTIMKDVFSLIAAGKIKPLRGDWCLIPQVKRSSNGEKDLRDLIVEEDAGCTACGLGAIFYAMVLRTNDITVEQAGASIDERDWQKPGVAVSFGSLSTYLEDIFTTDQMYLIECAFEMGNGNVYPSTNERVEAQQFGRKFRGNAARLEAICQNIIDNKGTFVPPKVDPKPI